MRRFQALAVFGLLAISHSACKARQPGSALRANDPSQFTSKPNALLAKDDAGDYIYGRVDADGNTLRKPYNPTKQFKSVKPKPAADGSSFEAGAVINQGSNEDCWFLASKQAYEFDQLFLNNEAIPYSLDYLYASLYRDWIPGYVSGQSPTGLQTGGDEYIFDKFMNLHGFMPMSAIDHGHNNTEWAKFDKELTAMADKFKATYAAAASKKGAKEIRAQVTADATAALEQFFTDNNVGPFDPTFAYRNESITPQDFLTKAGLDQGTTKSYVDSQAHADAYNGDATKNKKKPKPYTVISRDAIKKMIQENVDRGQVMRTAFNWSWSRIDEKASGIPGIIIDQHNTGTHESVPHEILTVGYLLDDNGDMVGVEIQNSWGRKEGENGYFYFDMDSYWDFFRDITERTYPNAPGGNQ